MTLPRDGLMVVGSKRICAAVIETILATVPGALNAVVTIDDQGDMRSELGLIERLADSAGIPCLLAESRAHADELFGLAAPRTMVVAGWYWLIDAKITERVTIAGIHHSLLPAYRGGSPLVWALINGEQTVGTSLFRISAGIDDGPVWGQATTTVEPDESIAEVGLKLDHLAAGLLQQHLPSVLDGTAIPVPQDDSRATLVRSRRPTDGEVDWSQTARHIHDFVRAQSAPYPGAYTSVDSDRLTIWRTRRTEKAISGIPGRYRSGLVVCGDGLALELTDVETSGDRGQASDILGAGAISLGAKA